MNSRRAKKKMLLPHETLYGIRMSGGRRLTNICRLFSESIKHRVENGLNGSNLVNEVLEEWERIVNRVAKTEVGEKMIVCGRAARWWDDEIRAKIEHRRQVYRLIVSGEEELWEGYYRLRKEVKQLVVEKKLNI